MKRTTPEQRRQYLEDQRAIAFRQYADITRTVALEQRKPTEAEQQKLRRLSSQIALLNAQI